MNENVVTIMAGSSTGTDLAIVQDIAEVLDGVDGLRVVPMVGKGPEQNIKDVMFLRGVDMGVTQANILKYFAKTGELGPNFIDQIAYVAKLFNEEMHILVRNDVSSIADLKGRPVNFGAEGSGTEITGRLVFEALGIDVKQVHLSDAEALQKLRVGGDRRHHRGDGQARAGSRQSQGRKRAQAARRALRQGARGQLLPGDA